MLFNEAGPGIIPGHKGGKQSLQRLRNWPEDSNLPESELEPRPAYLETWLLTSRAIVISMFH